MVFYICVTLAVYIITILVCAYAGFVKDMILQTYDLFVLNLRNF